jgi:hypothetical protein
MNKLLFPCLLTLVGCGGGTTYVHSDTTLGRVVIYRNGVAYFERFARVEGDTLNLDVPADKVDDFLKSLTVVDAKTGEPAPIAYPTSPTPSASGDVDMKIRLGGAGPHELKLSYVTEAPSWKPSYRVILGEGKRVNLQALAIVDNTSGEDWKSVKLGVGASSALSFRFDLRSVRLVQRETLRPDDLFAQAPPLGGASYGYYRQDGTPATGKKVVVELSDDVIASAAGESTAFERKPEEPEMSKASRHRQAPVAPNVTTATRGGGGKRPPADPGNYKGNAQGQTESQITVMARNLQTSPNQIVVEGYANKDDHDKFASSLDRANRVREQLIRNGLRPDQVVAVGNGEQAGRAGGVRIVEAPPAAQQQLQLANKEARDQDGKVEGGAAQPAPTEPIGTSHFESRTPMTVPRGTSAMISILKTDTEGEVVYLYDAESPRGNAEFPFRAVRIKNPTDSALESGPVTVFGNGKFIGEGLCEPIPARSVAFVPFALDRQIVVERKDGEQDRIARILSIQRGVFSTEVQHTKRFTFTFHNRMSEPATLYLRHTVAPGFTLTKAPKGEERINAAYLFRVEVPASDKLEVVVEESTPLFRTTDLRSPAGMELVKVFVSSDAAEGPLKAAIGELIKAQQEIGNLEQRIETMREQMGEYRTRMDELHAQLVTLKAVKTAGPLMQSLEKKLSEVSDKLSKATIDLVALQEKLMVARIRFQDGVADLSLEPKPAAEPEKKGDVAAPARRLGI